ncbi:MAG: bifunctional diguanylate cyclase/phosphodiesterase [Tissierellaceae bacterium]
MVGKNRKANLKIYIIPFIIITLIFATITVTMSRSIKNYYYELKKEEGLKIAGSISLSLSNTALAVDTINSLLEEILLTYLKTAENHREFYSEEFFENFSKIYDIDEIYAYTPEGVIEFSGTGKYIGWKAEEGHPVYDFMIGNDEILIEDIRRDSESNLYYKYAYIKNPDGTFIQIGILAEKVYDLLAQFRLQNILDEMAKGGDIVQLYSLNEDNIVTASTDRAMIGNKVENISLTSCRKGEICDWINDTNGIDLYEIFVPMENESINLVSLGIQYSLDSMTPVIRSNTFIAVAGIIIVYLALTYSIIATYRRKNKLISLAYFDSLTGLPNSAFLKQRIDEDKSKKKNGEKKAIIIIKYHNLNLKNITFGYEHGDMILKNFGEKVKSLEGKNISIFRLTGEKFVIYLDSYDDRDEILSIIKRVNSLIEEPLIVNKVKEYPIIKIGVVEYEDRTISLDELLKNATLALNYVDLSEGTNYRFFDESMQASVQRSEIIERELREAINQDFASDIYLLYQPILNSKTNKIETFEALARMRSERFGLVSPLEFIGIAEDNQLIIPLTYLILRKACRFMSDLIEMGYNTLRIAVNIPSIHLLQEDFVPNILEILEETGVEGSNLELEITETSLMENFDIINNRLKELRRHGISISIDDFGTGYSSFDRLSELNVDTLKIDQYFINKITDSNKDSIITSDIISFAHRLGLDTVAEGVELEIQKEYLLEYECDKLQGYLFSKPLPEEDAIKILKETNG